MKRFIIPLLLVTNMYAIAFTPDNIKEHDFSVKTICRDGRVIDVVTGTLDGIDIKIIQEHCTGHSPLDKYSCNHKLIKCTVEKKNDNTRP